MKKDGWISEKIGWVGEKKLVELVKKLVGLAQYKRNNNHRNGPNC